MAKVWVNWRAIGLAECHMKNKQVSSCQDDPLLRVCLLVHLVMTNKVSDAQKSFKPRALVIGLAQCVCRIGVSLRWQMLRPSWPPGSCSSSSPPVRTEMLAGHLTRLVCGLRRLSQSLATSFHALPTPKRHYARMDGHFLSLGCLSDKVEIRNS